MKTTIALGLLALFAFTGCDRIISLDTAKVDIGVSVNDATDFEKVVRSYTPAVADDPSTPKDESVPAKESFVTTEATKGAEFIFTSRPGSEFANITRYKITSDILNSVETVTSTPPVRYGLNTYVQSGYSCFDLPAPLGPVLATQSCPMFYKNAGDVSVTATPAFGTSSAPGTLVFSRGLGASLISKRVTSFSRLVTIVFGGISATGREFDLAPVQFVSSANLSGDFTNY